MPRRSIPARLSGLAGLLLAAGCAADSSTADGTGSGSDNPDSITIPFKPEPKSLNPNWQTDAGGFYPSGNIYSSLVTLDWGTVQGTQAYPDLAESWDSSADGTTYTFHLRDGVTWHDGEPLTSADVVYTYQTILDEQYPLAQYLDGATITAPDPQTVVVEFDEPNVSFVPLLAQASNWYGKILPKHIYEGTDWSANPANMEPVGSGPFKFKSWQRGSQITLEANEDYFLGPPELEELTFSLVTDAQVAMAGFQADQYPYLTNDFVSNFPEIREMKDSGGDPVVVETPSLYDRSILLNLDNEILSQPKVREALAYGVDRPGMATVAFSDLWEPTYNAGISGFDAYLNPDATFPEHDLDKAKQLLDEAGYPVEGGSRFTLRLTNYPVTDSTLIAQVLKEQLEALDITVKWEQYDLSTWQSKLTNGDFDLSTYFVRYGPDPAAYGEHFQTDGPRNFTGYSNAQVDEWLAEATSTTDDAARKELYGQVQQQLVMDIPYLPLFTENKISLVHEGWSGFPTQEEAFGKSMGWFGYYAVQ